MGNLYEHEEENLDEKNRSSSMKSVSFSEEPDTIMQVDGGESEYEFSEDDEKEYVPKPSQSRARGRQAAQSAIDVVNRYNSDEENTPLSQKKPKSKKGPKKASKVVTSSDSEEYVPSEEEYTPGPFL